MEAIKTNKSSGKDPAKPITSITVRMDKTSPIYTKLKARLADKTLDISTWAGVLMNELEMSLLANKEIERLKAVLESTQISYSQRSQYMSDVIEDLEVDVEKYCKHNIELLTEVADLKDAVSGNAYSNSAVSIERDHWKSAALSMASALSTEVLNRK
jgi:hypothetical protein